jgi:bilirubin oxidase
MITRRAFVKLSTAGGAGLYLSSSLGSPAQLLAQVSGGTLPNVVPKFVTPLVIPPAMPLERTDESVDYYRIAVRQFQQQILPAPFPRTTVWGYGAIDYPATFNYPGFTIEATAGRPTRVTWMNELVDSRGRYLPHLLPVDQTLHWANPPGGFAGEMAAASSRNPTLARFRS